MLSFFFSGRMSQPKRSTNPTVSIKDIEKFLDTKQTPPPKITDKKYSEYYREGLSTLKLAYLPGKLKSKIKRLSVEIKNIEKEMQPYKDKQWLLSESEQQKLKAEIKKNTVLAKHYSQIADPYSIFYIVDRTGACSASTEEQQKAIKKIEANYKTISFLEKFRCWRRTYVESQVAFSDLARKARIAINCNQKTLEQYELCTNSSELQKMRASVVKRITEKRLKIKEIEKEIQILESKSPNCINNYLASAEKICSLSKDKLWMLGVDYNDVINSAGNSATFEKNKNEPGYIKAINTAAVFALQAGCNKNPITAEFISQLHHLATHMVLSDGFIEGNGRAYISRDNPTGFAGGSSILSPRRVTLKGLEEMKTYEFLRKDNPQMQWLHDDSAENLYAAIKKGGIYRIAASHFYAKDDGSWDCWSFDKVRKGWYTDDVKQFISDYQKDIEAAKSPYEKLFSIAKFIRKLALLASLPNGNLRTIRLLTNVLLRQNELPHSTMHNWHDIYGHHSEEIAIKLFGGMKNYDLCVSFKPSMASSDGSPKIQFYSC